MTVTTSHSSLPPFPDNIPTAPIPTATLSTLLARDAAESQKVLTACQTHGFFYLDLRGCAPGEALIDESEKLRELAVRVFQLPLSEKLAHVRAKGGSIMGYKEAGTVKATDKDLRPDSTEFFNISKDHVHGIEKARSYPEEIGQERELLKRFTKDAHTCGLLVLTTLASQMGLEDNAFADLNIFTKPSQDHCRLTRKVPIMTDSKAVGLPSHTDFGSVTILFTWLGGLQIQSHDPKSLGEWEYVKPLPGHAIINLGDAMVKFTNGGLKSAKHRVVPAPGEQVSVDRYSIVYFVRPTNDVLMQPLEKFRAKDNIKVAGKFADSIDEVEVLRAGDWMRLRSVQLGS